MDDFYELELQTQSGVKGWSIPETKGVAPSPRESHTSVAYCGKNPKLYIFGGMSGQRMADLWQLDLGKVLAIFNFVLFVQGFRIVTFLMDVKGF